MKKPYLLLAFILALVGALAIVGRVRAVGPGEVAPQGTASYKIARGAFVKPLRTTGLVESIRFHNVAAPRLVGATAPGSNTLIITRLVPSGTHVAAEQLLVEFDRQNQLKAAIDRRSEHRDLEEQIRKKRAEQEQARAKDDTGISVAPSRHSSAVSSVASARRESRPRPPKAPKRGVASCPLCGALATRDRQNAPVCVRVISLSTKFLGRQSSPGDLSTALSTRGAQLAPAALASWCY